MIEIFGNIIDSIDTFLKSNPYAGVLIATLSIIANFVQLNEAARQRRSSKKEEAERALLLKELKTYRYLFDKADLHSQIDKSLQGIEAELAEKDHKLESIQQTVLEKESELSGLENRLEQLVLTAQTELIRKEIEHRLSQVRQELAEVEHLKVRHGIMDASLVLPDDLKEQLQSSLNEYLPEEQAELPRRLVFYASLLIGVVLLLPWPLDSIVLLVSLPLLFDLVIQMVDLLRNRRISRLFTKSYRLIVFAALFILWEGILGWIASFFEPLALILRETIYQSTYELISSSYYFGVIDPYLLAHTASRGVLVAIPIVVVLVISILHYSIIIRPVKVLINESLGNTE